MVNPRSTAPTPEPILQLQRQLEDFRSRQPARTKLPESLWQAAVELARPRHAGAISASSHITPAFSFCLGSVSKIWHPAFSAVWGHGFPRTGSRCMGIRSTFWRPSWIPNDFGEPATAQPTGSCSVTRQDAASNPTAMYRTDRSSRFWDTGGRSAFGNCSGQLHDACPSSCECQPGGVGPGPGRSARGPAERTDCEKFKTALHALAALLVRQRNTEKTKAVLPKPEDPGKDVGREPREESAPPAKGHGRNGAKAFSGAQRNEIQHPNLKHGDRCPDCGQGNVYAQKEPKVLVRIVGQAPLAATAYSLERLRRGACGQVFTAQEPEGVGPEKYEERATVMVAQLKYGSGVPFNRLEQLEAHLGIPLPATTQWEMVEEGAELIKLARDELIR